MRSSSLLKWVCENSTALSEGSMGGGRASKQMYNVHAHVDKSVNVRPTNVHGHRVIKHDIYSRSLIGLQSQALDIYACAHTHTHKHTYTHSYIHTMSCTLIYSGTLPYGHLQPSMIMQTLRFVWNAISIDLQTIRTKLTLIADTLASNL